MCSQYALQALFVALLARQASSAAASRAGAATHSRQRGVRQQREVQGAVRVAKRRSGW